MNKTGSGPFEVVTFDCSGTLIDWETGIRNAFRRALAKTGSSQIPESTVFNLYEEEERRIEKDNYRPYRDVLSLSTLAVAKKTGWKISETESHFLASELPNWKPFPDTNAALKRISQRHKLGILSNVDNDLLEKTLKHFAIPFEMIITAEKVRSSKPGLAYFREAQRVLGKGSSWLHAAASWYHDIDPAISLGINVAWVNRSNVPAPRPHLENVRIVRNLTELADWLGP